MSNALPYVGAAMPSEKLEIYSDWIIENQRDLEIQDFISPFLLDSDEVDVTIDKITSLLDGYTGRMGIHAPFINLQLAAWDPKIRAVVQERFKQALDVCAKLGATHMVVHSPLMFLGAPDSISMPTMGESGTLFDLIHDTMDDVVKQAEAIGCMLVIENIFDKLPLLLTNLVKSFESDCVRQSLDVGHAFIKFTEGAPPPDYYVREAGQLLGHVHLQDTDGYSDRHWTIGDGRVDWKILFDEIAVQGANPRLILELRDNDDIPRAVQYLKDHNLAQ